MMDNMTNLQGVEITKFDFCMLGTALEDMIGQVLSAKKRTAVMTNSPSIQLLLREAQCRREHRHMELLDGRARRARYISRDSADLCVKE